jgi:hypothetical protein
MELDMTKISDYFSNVIGDLQNYSPVALPSELPALNGFGFPDIPDSIFNGQMGSGEFAADALKIVWSVFPSEFQGDVSSIASDIFVALNKIDFQAINQLTAAAGTAGGSIGGVAAGIAAAAAPVLAIWGPVIAAINVWTKALVRYGHGLLEDNDQARRDARLEYVKAIEGLGPAGWGGGYYASAKYKRKRVFPQKAQYPLAWRPTDKGILSVTPSPTPISGDCGAGSAELSGGMDGSCTGATEIFPIFFPVWSNLAWKRSDPTFTLRAGMERSSDSGAAIWDLMIGMQVDALDNPITNLQMNGALIKREMESFRSWFWGKYWAQGWAPLTPEKRRLWIDNEFDEQGESQAGYYLTPGGLIAKYKRDNAGRVVGGELVGQDLDGRVILPSAQSHVYYNQYNSVISAAGQFFAMRAASLRSRSIAQEFVDSGLPTSEPGLRAAIQEVADGISAPAPTTNIVMEIVGVGLDSPSRVTPGGLGMIPPTPGPSPGSGGGGGGGGGGGIILLGVAAAALFAIAKKR